MNRAVKEAREEARRLGFSSNETEYPDVEVGEICYLKDVWNGEYKFYAYSMKSEPIGCCAYGVGDAGEIIYYWDFLDILDEDASYDDVLCRRIDIMAIDFQYSPRQMNCREEREK